MKTKIFTYRYLLFLSLCVSISYFLGARSINLELVGVIALSPLFLFIRGAKTDKNDWILMLMLLLMLITCYGHGEFRIFSYLFSVCFVLSFIYLKGEVKRGYFPAHNTANLLKILIYLYAIVLIIQQVCVLIGIPPVLASNYDENFKWKLSSLSPEPSHLVIFIFFMMYAHILLYEFDMGKEYRMKDARDEKFLWLAYFWCMLGSGSTSGLIYVLLIFLRFVNFKTIVLWGGSFAIALIVVNHYFSESQSLARVDSLLEAIVTLDGETILNADHSAAMRFSPMIYFFSHLDIGNVEFWLGHGMDYGKRVFNVYMFDVSGDGTYNEFDGVNMGGFWGFIMDYGVISFGILVTALVSFLRKITDKWYVFFYTILMMFMGLNMQMFWFATILSYIVSFYTKQNNSKTISYRRMVTQPSPKINISQE